MVSEPTATRRRQVSEVAWKVVDPVGENVVERVSEWTGGKGVEVVFDCAGVEVGLKSGMEVLRNYGLYVMVAVWPKPVSFNFFFIFILNSLLHTYLHLRRRESSSDTSLSKSPKPILTSFFSLLFPPTNPDQNPLLDLPRQTHHHERHPHLRRLRHGRSHRHDGSWKTRRL